MKERLKELRKALQLSQEGFGERLGITKASVSRLESGINNLTEQMFKSICREFHVNEDWLRDGEGEVFKTEDDLYEALIDAMGEIDELDRKIIIEYLKLPREHRNVFKDFFRSIITEE